MQSSKPQPPTTPTALPVGVSRRVKTFTACAAGISLALPVCFFTLPRLAIAHSPIDPRLSFILAGILFTPLILAISLLSRQVQGGGDLVSISRRYRIIPLTFAVSWLSIAGYLLIAALLIKVMGRYLKFFLEQSTQFDIPEPMAMLLIAIIALAKETFIDRKWWGTRAAFNVVCLTTLLVTVIRQLALSNFAQETIVSSTPFDRTGAIFGVMAAALWGVDSILSHLGQLRHGSKAAAIATTTSTSVAMLCGALMVCLHFSNPQVFHELVGLQERWSQGPSLSIGVTAALILCFAGLFRAIHHTTRTVAFILPDFEHQEKRERALRHLVVLLTLTAATAAAIYPSRLALAAAAGATYFWALSLSISPVLFSKEKAALLLNGKQGKGLRPIAYGLLLVSIYVTSLLPWSLTGGVIFWLILGGITYALLSTWNLPELEEEDQPTHTSPKVIDSETIVGVVTESADWESLARALHSLAAEKNQRAVLLESFPQDEMLPIREQSKRARRHLRLMQGKLQEKFPEGTDVQPQVLLGNTTAEVLHSFEEDTQVSLIVLHIDPRQERRPDIDLDDVEEIFQSFDHAIALLYGRYRSKAESVQLLLKRKADIRPFAELAVAFQTDHKALDLILPESLSPEQQKIIEELEGESEPKVAVNSAQFIAGATEAEHVASATKESTDTPQPQDSKTGKQKNNQIAISANIQIVGTEREGFNFAEQQSSSFFFLESAYDSVIGRSIFGGPPLELARKRRGLTVIFKPRKAHVITSGAVSQSWLPNLYRLLPIVIALRSYPIRQSRLVAPRTSSFSWSLRLSSLSVVSWPIALLS